MLPKSKPHLTSQQSKIIRILIVDDLKTIREFLFSVLDAESDLEVIGMAINGEDAVAKSLQLQPDLILMDIEMPKQNGISASRIILQQFPEVKILVFSSNVNREYVVDSLAAGVKGYLLKNVSEAELIEAIHYVHKGYLHVAPGVFEQLLSFPPKLSSVGQAEKTLQSDGGVISNRLQSSPPTKPFKTSESSPAKQKFRSGVRWITWSAILASIGIGGLVIYGWIYNKRSQPVTVSMASVEKQNVRDLVNQSGVVELGNQQNVKSPVDGTVETVLTKPGKIVNPNQTLVVLKDPARETALAQQQLEIQKQELALQRSQGKVSEISYQLKLAQQKQEIEIKNEIRQQQRQIVRNQERIMEDQQRLKIAQTRLQQLEKLFSQGILSENDLQQQQENYLNIQSQLRNTKLEAETATLVLQTLQQQQKDKRQEFDDNILNFQTQLKDAQLEAKTNLQELDRLKLEGKKIEQEVEQNLVKANFQGKVLNLQVQVGDVVKLGNILLTLGDPDVEIVRVYLSPLEARRVKIGQIARIRAIGPQTKSFSGKVSTISEAATNVQQGGNENKENPNSGQATVVATIQLEKPSEILLPGSKVDVEIEVAARNDVVAIGQDIIQDYDTNPFVWVEDSQGKVQKRDIILGLNGLTIVEVTSGLSPGDRVIIPPPELSIEAGMPVTVENP